MRRKSSQHDQIYTIFCVFYFISTPNLFSQQDSIGLIYSISNLNIKFDLTMEGGGTFYTNHTMDVPKFRIEVTYPNFPSGFLDRHRKEVIIELIKLMDDPKKDWCANILLYYITQREAIPLFGIYNKSDWTQHLKSFDSSYWHKNYIDK